MDSLRAAPLIPAGSIRLLDHRAFLGGAVVGGWVTFPANYAQAELVIVYETVEALGGTLGVGLETTYDMDSVVVLVNPTITMVSAPTVLRKDLGGTLGPLMRYVVGATSQSLKAVISAWLTPKRA